MFQNHKQIISFCSAQPRISALFSSLGILQREVVIIIRRRGCSRAFIPCWSYHTSCCGRSKVLMLGLSSSFSTCCRAFCSMLIGSVALTDTCFVKISLALLLRLSDSTIFLYCSTALQKMMFSWLNSFFKNSCKKNQRSLNRIFINASVFIVYPCMYKEIITS